jgi:hypothetical protein
MVGNLDDYPKLLLYLLFFSVRVGVGGESVDLGSLF